MKDYLITTHLDVEERHEKPKNNNGKLRIALFNNLVELEVDEFVEAVTRYGKSFSTTVMDGKGSKEGNYKSNMLFAMDIDNNLNDLPFEDMTKIEDFTNFFEILGIPPFLIYETFSSKPEHPKFRAVWKLNYMNEEPVIFNLISKMLYEIFTLNFNSKSIDRPASLGINRMFFGTNLGYAYYEKDNVLNAAKLFDELIHLKSIQLENKHNGTASRDRNRFLKKLNILEFKKIYNVILRDNIYNVFFWIKKLDQNEDLTIIYSKFSKMIQKSDPRHCTLQGIVMQNRSYSYALLLEDNVDRRINVDKSLKSDHDTVLLTPSDIVVNQDTLKEKTLSMLQSECNIIKHFLKGEHLPHNDRFILLGFLSNFTNGIQHYNKYLKSIGKITDTNITSYMNRKYLTGNCKNSEICGKDHNIFVLYNNALNDVVKDEVKYVDTNELRSNMKLTFENILHSKDNEIHIVKIDTGIGKTSLMHELLNHVDNYLFCFFLHDKKDEFKGEVPDDVYIQKRLPDCINGLHKEFIDSLLEQGINILPTLKVLSKAPDYTEKEKRIIREHIKSYERIHDLKKIYITHARSIYELNNENIKNIIFDETPEKTLHICKSVKYNDITFLMNWSKRQTLNDELDKLVNYYENILDMENGDIIRNEKLFLDLTECLKYDVLMTMDSPVCEMMRADYIMKSKNNDDYIFITLRKLPHDKKIIILSATPNIEELRQIYGNRVKVHEFDKPLLKGKLLQYRKKSYSKYHFQKNDDAMGVVSNIYHQHNFDILITHKSLAGRFARFHQIPKENIFNFGGIEGLNSMSGKDILIAGTPNPPKNYIQLIAKTIYHHDIPEINDPKMMCMQQVHYDGVTFKFFTYRDEVARNIHLQWVWNHLTQAVGRARLLNISCRVLLLSNFVLHDAFQLNTLDELD